MVNRALSYLAQDPGNPVICDQPFFLFLHLFDAHYPYEPQWPFDTAFVPSYRPDIRRLSGSHPYSQDKNLSPDELFEIVALYDGEIAYTDYELGRFFEHLEELGLYDSSMIIVMADHGEGFLEHGLMNHGNSVYEELVRVPLIMRFPGGRFAGRRIDTPVQLIDVTPTILEHIGEKPAAISQGSSLLELMGPGNQAPRFTYSSEGYAACIRTDSWKLIVNPPNRSQVIPRALTAEYELYDLSKDPAEQSNLASVHTDRVQSMARALRRLDENNKELRRKLRATLEIHSLELTEDEKKQLKALGYIQ